MGLDFVECVMSLEEEFGLRLTDEEVSHWRTVKDAVDHLDRRLLGTPERAALWNSVRHIAAEQSGWPIERIDESTPFTDLFPHG